MPAREKCVQNRLRSNHFSNRRLKSGSLERFGRGLYRYRQTGVIYGVFKVQGQTVWKT
jgi:hypothetical protein